MSEKGKRPMVINSFSSGSTNLIASLKLTNVPLPGPSLSLPLSLFLPLPLSLSLTQYLILQTSKWYVEDFWLYCISTCVYCNYSFLFLKIMRKCYCVLKTVSYLGLLLMAIVSNSIVKVYILLILETKIEEKILYANRHFCKLFKTKSYNLISRTSLS